MLFTVALAVWQFQLLLRGSFRLLLASTLFMLVSLAMGLPSPYASSQAHAGLYSFITVRGSGNAGSTCMLLVDSTRGDQKWRNAG